MDIFKHALRNKFRFNLNGKLNTEDLWDLSMENLDKLYKSLLTEKANSESENSLFDDHPSTGTIQAQSDIDIKIDIVKFIFGEKQFAEKANAESIAKAEKRRALENAIHAKENAEMMDKSIEELRNMYDSI